MQALSVTEGAVWGGGLHAADTRAKMFVSLLASVATVALSGVEPQMVLFGMSLVYALGMRQFRILLIGYAVLVGMSLLAMGCAFGMSLLIPSMPAFSAVSLVVPFLRMATMLNVILPLAFSCRVQSLLTALKSLHLPFCLYLPAAVMIRFIPTFLHDAKQVSETLRIRGWRMTPWNAFRHPVLLIRLVFTPLLFRSLKTSEELRRTQGARLRRRDAPLPEAGLEGVRHMAFGRGLPCGGCGGAVPTCRGMGPAGRRDALMIRFERVTYTYPFQTCPAVSDISFSVRPGELVLCTGASGCGKSTLMRLANGLCPHYFQGTLEGRVLIGGEPTDARPINAIAREVGTLFQDPEQQFFALNVEDELAFAHEWQGVSPEAIAVKIDEAARAFRLGPILSSSIHELSEGQKQKVGLASILSQGPRALILDEPSANLDPEATEDLACKLAELKAWGMAILVVDHRLYWLEGIADRVLVMREGRIAERGGFDLLYDDALRGRCGLRAARIDDPRRTLPDCAEELLEPGEGGLVVSGLRFAYSGKPALFDGVDVSIPAGVTALIGDNGTGKTTLARLLTGLNAAQEGRFAIAGQPVPASKLLSRVGIVLQNADHQLHMKTVRQELEVSLSLAGGGADDVPGLLSLFALEGLAERHPQSLSGGEKQRLVIACAFAKRPDVLILDEPTSGLDGRNMRRIADALDLLAGRGACVLVITHDLELMGLSCARALRLPLS